MLKRLTQTELVVELVTLQLTEVVLSHDLNEAQWGLAQLVSLYISAIAIVEKTSLPQMYCSIPSFFHLLHLTSEFPGVIR